MSTELVAVTSSAHPLVARSRQGKLRWAELSGATVLVLDIGPDDVTRLQRGVRAAALAAGMTPRPIELRRVPLTEATIELARAGLGVAIVGSMDGGALPEAPRDHRPLAHSAHPAHVLWSLPPEQPARAPHRGLDPRGARARPPCAGRPRRREAPPTIRLLDLRELMLDVLSALARAKECLAPVLDVVERRVRDDGPPPWCEARGWSAFLLGLDDAAVERSEAEGLAHCIDSLGGAPESLRALAQETRAAAALPALHRVEASASIRRSVPLRKQWQLEQLLAVIAPLAEPAARIVDVGAGHGHFARLAADRFARETLGLDRDERRIEKASLLAAATPAARFTTFDACHEPLPLGERDLALGLHACGELGDRLVLAAALGGSDPALVSCCFQKIRAPSRAPLSRAGSGLTLTREALGVANVTSRPAGVETSLVATMAARGARHALFRLLRARGEELLPGAEMRGVNRRQAHAGLASLAERALALRGLAPASQAELAACEAESALAFARLRRLSLPRAMLARLVEVALVLDRAAALREAGHAVLVAEVFDQAVSPRNIGLFASRAPARIAAIAEGLTPVAPAPPSSRRAAPLRA